MTRFAKLLKNAPVLFEGAMGTMLMARGLAAGQPGEAFTLERPEVIAEVHRQYVAAGARVLVTNTFNANRLRLGKGSLAGKVEECNRRAVEIAREEAGDACVVAGSMGPTGQLLAPSGVLTPAEARDAFAEQATVLDEAGVDVFLVETMFDANEALAAIEACRGVSKRPIVATMAFADTPRGFFTMMGNAAAETLPRLLAAGASAVGANCQLASEAMVRLAAELKKCVDAPLLIKPNAGKPDVGEDVPAYSESAEVFAENAVKLAGLRVEMIGGCCGTTPEYIARARARLQARAK